MELWTIQMAKHRLAKEHGILFLDTTIKSGVGDGALFAPTWEMVMGHKDGTLSDEAYREQYLALMRHRYLSRAGDWQRFIKSTGRVAIACYCAPGKFCHRHLLKECLERSCGIVNIEFIYHGELQ